MPLRFQTEPAVSATSAPAVHPVAISRRAAHRPRLDGIDFLRGLVMVLMVLDHARDYVSGGALNPRDVNDAALFLTRWVTHYCAPVFILLAGVSAYLYGSRGRPTRDLARFLLTRGVWLIFIEVTLVRLGWTFNLSYDFIFLQVIWVIGWSMIVLAGLIYLPRPMLVAISVWTIVGHHLLDGLDAKQFGAWSWWWSLVHAPGMLTSNSDVQILAIYPLIPWFGVMLAGFVLGPVFQQPERVRRRTLLQLGVLVTIGFVVLRATNFYGDPVPWTVQENWLATLLSFINCEKYPPSLMYLTMTLGPALIALSLFKTANNPLSRAIVTIGRVPFLFYVAHIFLVHAIAIALSAWMGFGIGWLFEGMPAMAKPAGFGVSLSAVYVTWIAAVLMLYPLCKWFAAVKQRRKDWWLSYL